MHGCRTQPATIVLNRQDYLRYQQQRGALAGLVQALLLTRHLLFVGFSLRDDNFLALMDEVRRACPEPHGRLGTALMLGSSDALRKLWQNELDLVFLQNPRELENFLDCVLAHCADTSRHLLQRGYADLLGAEERWFKAELLRVRDQVPESFKRSAAWMEFEKLIARLGG